MPEPHRNIDRPFSAEDLLAEMHAKLNASRDAPLSVSDLIEGHLDRMPEPKLQVSVRSDPDPPSNSRVSSVEQVGAQKHNHKPGIPAAPPIAVPNHELIRCLGVGGFGQVWLARHKILGHYRACKLIWKSKDIELEGLKTLKQRVPPHPALLPIEDVSETDGWLCCFMPRADNAAGTSGVLDVSSYEPFTLDLYIERRGRLSSSEARMLAAELADGLAHLHEHDATHGDVKPSNILRFDDRWVLADYGLLRARVGSDHKAHTPGYVPPEGPGGKPADQYALGVVLMKLIMGWGPRRLAEFKRMGSDESGLDEEGLPLRGVILRATADSPDGRFGSLRELSLELRRKSVPQTAVKITPPARRAIDKKWLPAALIAAGAIAIGVTAVRDLCSHFSGGPRIKSFDVIRYRLSEQSRRLEPVGRIGPDTVHAEVDDDVEVIVELTAPAYFYVISLDTSGRVRCRVPASADERPVAAQTLRYPAEGELYRLEKKDEPGAQAFIIVASRNPLPTWTAFSRDHPLPKWNAHEIPQTVITYDGIRPTVYGETREPRTKRGDDPLLDPIRSWLDTLDPTYVKQIIIFPVTQRSANDSQKK